MFLQDPIIFGIYIAFVFILGTIVGSFLNVVILRYNTGRSVNGRSGCMSCGRKLTVLDLVPVLSWIFLRGKCRQCKSKISIQYPLVEFFTGLLFLFIFISASPLFANINLTLLYFVWNAVIFSILIIIFVYDIYHKIIPDGLSYTFAVMAFLQTFILLPSLGEFTTINWLNLFSGVIMFLPFFILWLVSAGKWIGLGDGKLALGIGWYLGFVNGISAIVIGFWIGAIFAVTLMLIGQLNERFKNITMKSEIPFAPFLILGTVIEFFLRVDVIGVGLFF
jgi:leader peptidase (prepilin peptidase)/N-methyltransferase